MRKVRSLVAVMSAAVLLLTVAAPVAAKKPVGIAEGTVEWKIQGDKPATSVFSVRDGRPGTKSRKGDRGRYYLSRPAGPDYEGGSLLIDVECVRVNDGWAEFAGRTVEATGVYVEGEIWRVSVADGGQGWANDEIGMKGKFTDIDTACNYALSGSPFGRKGVVTGGDIRVWVR